LFLPNKGISRERFLKIFVLIFGKILKKVPKGPVAGWAEAKKRSKFMKKEANFMKNFPRRNIFPSPPIEKPVGLSVFPKKINDRRK